MDLVGILLRSTSEIKLTALKSCHLNLSVETSSVSDDEMAGRFNAPQPVGEFGLVCAKMRITSVPAAVRSRYQFVVAIESSCRYDKDQQKGYDVVNVVVLDVASGHYRGESGGDIEFPLQYLTEARASGEWPSSSGYHVTVGEILQKHGKTNNAKNWMKDVANTDRVDQITPILRKALDRAFVISDAPFSATDLVANARYVPNHPRGGVLYKDIGPMMASGRLFSALVDQLAHLVKRSLGNCSSDVVVGLDARGFIFGAAVAKALGAGFVMARKPSTLPEPKVDVEYGTEYSKNHRLEIAVDAFDNVPNGEKRQPRAVIVDDLLATGGSMAAAVELLGKTNRPPEILGCYAVLYVESLLPTARQKLKALGVEVVETLQ